MSIIHIRKRENPYVMIDKRPLENEEMSWQAKGMLTYLLSKPANWNVCVEDLINRSKDGKTAVYATIKELEALGHIVKSAHRQDGRITKWIYDVFEEPEKANGANGATSRFSRSRKPSSRKPISRKSATSNNESNNNEDSKNEVDAVASPEPLKVVSGSHQDFVDAYFKFYEKKVEIAPHLLESDYAGLKKIRRYLIKAKKDNALDALASWRYILDNWGKLSDFLQKQLKPAQIDRYMANILDELRNQLDKVARVETKAVSMAVEEVENLFGGVNPDFKEEVFTPKYPLR